MFLEQIHGLKKAKKWYFISEVRGQNKFHLVKWAVINIQPPCKLFFGWARYKYRENVVKFMLWHYTFSEIPTMHSDMMTN